MAIFVDLDEESESPQTQAFHGEWDGERAKLQLQQQLLAVVNTHAHAQNSSAAHDDEAPPADQYIHDNPNSSRMTEALGCYPYVLVSVYSTPFDAGHRAGTRPPNSNIICEFLLRSWRSDSEAPTEEGAMLLTAYNIASSSRWLLGLTSIPSITSRGHVVRSAGICCSTTGL